MAVGNRLQPGNANDKPDEQSAQREAAEAPMSRDNRGSVTQEQSQKHLVGVTPGA